MALGEENSPESPFSELLEAPAPYTFDDTAIGLLDVLGVPAVGAAAVDSGQWGHTLEVMVT